MKAVTGATAVQRGGVRGVEAVTSTMVDPQVNRMHTAKKIFRGCGGSEGNTIELITVTWETQRHGSEMEDEGDSGSGNSHRSTVIQPMVWSELQANGIQK